MGMYYEQKLGRKPTSHLAQGPIIQPNAVAGSTYLWYDTTFGQDPNLKYPGMVVELGTVWYEQDIGGFGLVNGFQYVKLDASVTVGVAVAASAVANDVVIAAGSDTTKVQLTNITVATNADVGNLLSIDNAGTNAQLRVIKANTANSDTPARVYTVSQRDLNNTFNANDADALPYTPTNGTAVTVIRPFNRVICTASLVPQGIAINAVTYTTNPYAVVQIAGIAMCKAGTTTARTFGKPNVIDASGRVDQNATLSYYAGNSILSCTGSTPVVDSLYPCFINFTGTI